MKKLEYIIPLLFFILLNFYASAQSDVTSYVRIAEQHDINGSYEEAARWYLKAAEQGHAKAQCCLGAYYYVGQGVRKNLMEAIKWWYKSAEQGYAEAQCYIGICYYEGYGFIQDREEGAKWFRKAAEQGIINAQYNLADYYVQNKNYTESFKWYKMDSS